MKQKAKAGPVAAAPAPTISEATASFDAIERNDRILDFRAVRELVPVSKATLMRWERQGAFPRRVRLSKRCVGWLLSEVTTFINSRPRGLAL